VLERVWSLERCREPAQGGREGGKEGGSEREGD
jgi:hypothetical protein